MSPFRFGLIALIVLLVLIYIAYAGIGCGSAYTFDAVFETAQNLEVEAPVRTAGVPVGSVTKVEPVPGGSGAARVTLEITEEEGLPIHEDALLKIRPRIFLEGNSFVDLSPGSPTAPELDEGDTIPVTQTSTPVSFGDVLTSLQRGTRGNLRTLFEEYGRNALGGGGAEGFNRSIKYWEDAYRNTAIANQAALGTQEGDLNKVISGQQRLAAALSRNPDQLQGLVTNFNRTAAAFASQEAALSAAIPALRDTLVVGRPALQSLNATLPGVNEFARAALPAAESSRDTIPKVYPFVHQTRLLFGRSELRGLARELRRTVPSLARLNPATVRLLQQQRALSRCQNQVLLRWARDTDWRDAGVDHAGGQSGEPPYKIFPRSLEGLAGESRETDANSPVFRVLGLGGLETIINFLEPEGVPIFGTNPFKVNAVQPPSPIDENGVLADPPAHRPDVPCEDQVPPDLHAPVGAPPLSVSSSGTVSGSAPAGYQAKVGEFLRSRDGVAETAPEDASEKVAELEAEVDRILSDLEGGEVKPFESLDGLFGGSNLEELIAEGATP
jgi:virulence factor Mce-like protein